jgi:hypothetical protein
MSSNERAAEWVSPFSRRKLAVLPPWRPAPEAPETDAPAAPGPTDDRPEVVRRAEALGIPWERILGEEIRAEQALRRYVDDLDADWPLTAPMTVLSLSFLQSWRVRDRIQALAAEARGGFSRAAVRTLRAVFQRLSGKVLRDQAAMAEHLWFAYQRVLLLQRVSLAASRSRGTTAERVAFVCSRTRCSFDDAAWAVCHEGSRRQGHRLDAAIRKVRDEGFQIPRAESESRAFARLRSIVRASGRLARRRRRSSKPGAPALPHRVALPADAI